MSIRVQNISLAWISAKDFQESVKFFTDIFGLKLLSSNEDFQWAELAGSEDQDAMLGIGGDDPDSPLQPGQNAVITFTVTNIEQAKEVLESKNVEIVGDIVTIPQHVKLLLFRDPSGNLFHLVEPLS